MRIARSCTARAVESPRSCFRAGAGNRCADRFRLRSEDAVKPNRIPNPPVTRSSGCILVGSAGGRASKGSVTEVPCSIATRSACSPLASFGPGVVQLLKSSKTVSRLGGSLLGAYRPAEGPGGGLLVSRILEGPGTPVQVGPREATIVGLERRSGTPHRVPASDSEKRP